MNQEHTSKAVAYIIIAIVVILALGAFIYYTLVSKQNQVPVTAGQNQAVPLTAEQSAEKAAIISSIQAQTPQNLSSQQSADKAAIIKNSTKAQ